MITSLFVFASLVTQNLFAEKLTYKFSGRERVIVYDVIKKYKKECGHISLVDRSKISEIQESFNQSKDTLNLDQRECFEGYVSQIVGGHKIYTDLCDEVTPKQRFGSDKNLARLFANIRKYEKGIRPFHEKLNDCLLRSGADEKIRLKFSEYENNLKQISKKIRYSTPKLPFVENNVDLR